MAAIIQFGVGWNDMGPSLLLLMALHYIDLPIIVALQRFGFNQLHFSVDGTYALLAFSGALFWFAVGVIVKGMVCLAMSIRRRFRNTIGN